MHHAFLTIILIIRHSWRHDLARTLALAAAALALAVVAACGDAARGRADRRQGRRGRRLLPAAVRRRAGRRRRGRGHQPGQARRRAARPGARPRARSARSADAELVVYLKGFQPAVDEAVAQDGGDRAFDVGDRGAAARRRRGRARPRGRAEASTPRRRAARTRTSGSTRPGWPRSATSSPSGSAEVDPARAADYPPGPRRCAPSWTTLDAEFAAGLATCQRREIVTSHAAFGYLADRYGLDQVGITGLVPGGRADRRSASPRSPREARRARRHHDLLRDAGQPEGRRDHRRARSARRPPCSTRSKGCQPAARATTFRSCAPTWPRSGTALGCS